MLRILAGIAGLVELVYNLFGVPGVAVLIASLVGLIWAIYRYGGELFTWLLFRNFAAHGKVLRDAKVEIHSILPAPAPEPDSEDLEFEEALEGADLPDEPDFSHFYVEATVTPRQDPKTLEHPEDGWHPSSLMLIEGGRQSVELMEVDGAGFIHDAWLIRGQQLTPVADQALHGPARLRLHIGVRPDCRRLQFLCMQEVFGEIVVPQLPILPAANLATANLATSNWATAKR